MRGGPDCFMFQKSGDRTFTTVNSPVCLFGGEVANPNFHQPRRPPVRRLLLLKDRGPVSSHPQPVPCGKGSPKKSLEFRTAAQAVLGLTQPHLGRDPGTYSSTSHTGRVPGLRLPRLDSQRHRGFEDPVHDMLTRLHFALFILIIFHDALPT